MVSIRVENLSLAYKIPRGTRFGRKRKTRHPGGNMSRSKSGSVVEALNHVSFSLASGDRLGLVGTNGAGKTTLLKVLYGIYEPTHGQVDVVGRTDALFNINLGFRKEATGRRNIVLRGLINGWGMSQINERMEEIIEFSELGDFIDLPLKTYSQGMAARLAFSVATALDPEILLMDEWIGAGDPEFQAKARSRMNDLAERAGIIVLASHNHALLERTCNKILELESGQVKAFQPAEEWFEGRGDEASD